MDLDTFFVAVERLENSALNGIPVIVGGLSDRGVVSTCSYEARKFGVHSAMPVKMAKRLCKDAVFIRGDMDKYSRYSRLVTEVINESSPAYEKASIDEHYIDLTGMDRFFGAFKWSVELRQRIIKETGLPISFGLSVNKTVSKIATGEAKPNGQLYIESSFINRFLDPLSIKKIPMIGNKTFTSLSMMGINNVKSLRIMPKDIIIDALGKSGLIIWERANGFDNTPVYTCWERKSISAERTFEKDSIDVKSIMRLVIKMTEKLAFQLRKEGKLASIVYVKIRYANFDTHSRQKKIKYTAIDDLLISTAKELFNQLYNRRMLIRLVGVKLSGLIRGTQQLFLFDDSSKKMSLYKEMDYIRKKYGDQAVRRALG
jgi:DNA polymerase-4